MSCWCRLFCLACLCLLTPIQARNLAQFRTVFGDIEIELFAEDKPLTVQNFVRYIQSGAYQDGFVHRLQPGFVVQGGGYTVTNRGRDDWMVAAVPTFPPIINEFAVGSRFSNTFGTIAMAKVGGNTNSATSQWFINLANNTFLDANDSTNLFVVFGKVRSGINVLNTLNRFQYWTGSQTSNLVAYVAPFDSLPLLKPIIASTNLLYVDVTLLQVTVEAAATNSRRISWNSASGLTNIVEFTTNFPPIWHLLAATNGTGARFGVVDASSEPSRFYRVRVQ